MLYALLRKKRKADGPPRRRKKKKKERKKPNSLERKGESQLGFQVIDGSD